MELQKTIDNLHKLSNISLKKGYLGDATEYAFREHVLELLRAEVRLRFDKIEKKVDKIGRDIDFYIKHIED